MKNVLLEEKVIFVGISAKKVISLKKLCTMFISWLSMHDQIWSSQYMKLPWIRDNFGIRTLVPS